MALDVRTFYRGTLAGQAGFASGGVNSSGAAKNTKTVVVGDVHVTASYTAAGEPLTAADLGLATLDCILLSPHWVDDASTGLPAADNILVANYDYSAEQFLMWDGSAGTTEANTTCRVRFAAFGDAATPELT